MQTKKINRRDLLSYGVKGMAGVAGLTGPWASLLAQGQQQAIIPYILFVYCSGGWDTTMVFENKTQSGYCTAETGALAATGAGQLTYVDHPSRPAVKSFFDTYSANAAVVNGVHVGSLDRNTAVNRTFGAVPPGKNRLVDWLSFYAASLNPIAPMAHTVIDAPFLPGEYTAVATRLTSDTIQEYLGATPGDTLGADGEAALAAFRQSAYAKFPEQAQGTSLDGEKLKSLYYGYAHESNIGAELATAAASLGAPGTDTPFERNGKLAVELFAQGASQAVTLQCGADDLWDTTHSNYAQQTQNYQMLFKGLDKIIQHAMQRGIGDRMIVVVTSERGRAPKLNAQGGKGPWPYTSALLWGPVINGGTVVGATDDALRGLPVNPLFGGVGGSGAVTLEMGHIIAAIYLKTNVPVKLMIPSLTPLSSLIKGAS